jgi:hypothetical protein
VLLGLDRAPEVKTLRRKLGELAAQQRATTFSRQLAERWVRDHAEAVGVLYIDGHVRPYNGTTHTLPKGYVTRRRLCMPATTDVWVNQQDAQPLFVVTAPANDDLLAMLRREILPHVRSLVGARRVTLVFDREGWSPKFFRELHLQGFDVLTYRKGRYAPWPLEAFHTVTGVVDGRAVTYELAERRVAVLKGFPMREIRRLCANGHQTAIVTTRGDLAIEVAAYRMFERWTQENFFRYMRQHFALDALVTYAVEPADPERTVPNPQRKALAKVLAKSHAAISSRPPTRRSSSSSWTRPPATSTGWTSIGCCPCPSRIWTGSEPALSRATSPLPMPTSGMSPRSTSGASASWWATVSVSWASWTAIRTRTRSCRLLTARRSSARWCPGAGACASGPIGCRGPTATSTRGTSSSARAPTSRCWIGAGGNGASPRMT